jgi:hypothetical protein
VSDASTAAAVLDDASNAASTSAAVAGPPTPPASPSLGDDAAHGGGNSGAGAVAAFDFDEIETNIDEVILCFSTKHHAFLREFLLTQHFLFFATRVASATDKLTLVDQKLSELGALLRTRSPAANAQRVMPKKPDFDSIMSTPVAGGARGSTTTVVAPARNAQAAASSEKAAAS